jgi:hypothetical protein
MPAQFKPHYPPGTLRSHFSAEEFLNHPLSTLRVIYPPEIPHFPTSLHVSSNAGTHPSTQLNIIPMSSGEAGPVQDTNQHPAPDIPPSGHAMQLNSIPKPNGEAGRPSNGYNLKQYCTDEQSHIGWSEAQFFEAQVSQEPFKAAHSLIY